MVKSKIKKQNSVILYKNIYFIKCETGKYLQTLEQNYKHCGEWQNTLNWMINKLDTLWVLVAVTGSVPKNQ